MHALGEGLGQPVGERLAEDLRVVVIGPGEALGDRLLADSGGHREAADEVGAPGLRRRDEIGKRDMAALAVLPRDLLAKRVEPGPLRRPRLVGVDDDVVAVGGRRPEADDAARREPVLGDHLPEHRLGVVEERARRGADLRVVEEERIGALDLPGGEERRPVDVGDQLGDRIVGEAPRAEEGRSRRPV